MVSIVVGMAKNGVIGKNNDLPWYLPEDLKRFKKITTGHTVIMGRKTYESILSRLGKPLPNRTNIIVTRDAGYTAKGVKIAHSLEEALNKAHPDDSELFVIGGAEVYRQALPFADRIYLTRIDAAIDGDTQFPALRPSEWMEVTSENHPKDDTHQYSFDFVVLERKQ